QRALPGCLSEHGDPSLPGVGTYALRVAGADDDDALTLYCFDSHSYAPSPIGGYAWVRHEQVSWYRAAAAARRHRHGGARRPALAFLHIPVPEFIDVWRANVCVGTQGEAVCCPRINT